MKRLYASCNTILSTVNCWSPVSQRLLFIAFILNSFFSGASHPLKAALPDTLFTTAKPVNTGEDTVTFADSIVLAEDFKSKVVYRAEDSILYDLTEEKAYLYGKASIEYEDIRLDAAYIEIRFGTRVIFASGLPDSSEQLTGQPVFQQGEDVFNAETITYNFDTKRGRISGISTKDGDSYIHGKTVKKDADNTTYIRNGYYTTCNAEHPHYYLKSNKIKVIPNNKVVTGPGDLFIADVPTPLAIPFGFFPNKKGRSSGILFPQYGESRQLGFFLKNGGYYLGLSDHVDLALTGDIYSKGSWRVNAGSNYAWRYRFNGSFSANYSNTRVSRPEFPDYSLEKAFFIRWIHNQDPKARPGETFTANVNAGSSSFYRFNLTNANNFLTNTFTSSIAWAKSWQGRPFNLSTSLSHTQNTQTRDISLSLPSATFNVARRTPFKRRIQVGPERFFEKIGVGYTASFLNSISTKDSLLFREGSLDDFRFGLQHSIPVNTSFTIAKHFNISPSVNYTERWYLKTIRKEWDTESGQLNTDTVDRFRAARDISFSANLNTRIYGMLQFRKGKIAALRHVMIPVIGYSWRPDLSQPSYGYYKSTQADSTGRTLSYSIFEGSIFGGPGAGKSSLLTFGLDNNFEMKVRQRTDTSETMKKIKLLESLSLNTAYNLAADSLNWSLINVNGRVTIMEKVTVNMFGVFDPYETDVRGVRISKSVWSNRGTPARFTSGNFSINFNILGKKKDYKSDKGAEGELDEINKSPDDYLDFNIPFNLSVGYNIFFQNNVTLPDQVTQTLNFNGDLQLTKAWKVNYTSGYDFQQKEVSYTSIGIYRDLHCWEMSLNWVPFGFQQNFFFQINVKSSVLQDLKLTRKNDRFDNR